MSGFVSDINRVIGGSESHVVVGVAAYTVTGNMRGYAITCRITGTVIAAITVQDKNGVARSYSPTWLGIPLVAGESLISQFPIVSIILTAATDSIIIHCDRPY